MITRCLSELFVQAAWAAEADAAAQPQGGIVSLMLPIGMFVIVFYFLIFRPQKKKQKEHDNMISSITRGDTVVTAGGFFGRVCDVLEDSYIIELAEGVKVRILKSSISMKRDDPSAGARPLVRRKKRRRKIEGAEGIETEASPSDATSSGDGVTPAEEEALSAAPQEEESHAEKR